MAIDFTRSSSQYLTASVAPITTTPCTLACWFKADDITQQHLLLSVMDDGTGSVDGFYIQAVGNTAGDPIRASVAAAGSFGEAATTTGYSANAWQHACGVFTSATSRAAFLNGGGKGTNATSRAPSGLSRTMVGRYNTGASNVYSDAAIAEAAIWDTDLTDAEVAILATGVSPLFVRPQNLVFYAPLSGSNGTEIDLIGGASVTWVNSPVKAEHPRIIRPSAKILTFPSAASSSTTVAVPKASLVLTGHAPTVSVTSNVTVSVPKGSLVLSGYAPTVTVSSGTTIFVPKASLTLTGYAPNVLVPQVVQVPKGGLVLTGYAPDVLTPVTVLVPKGTLTITGYAPTIVVTSNKLIEVPKGALVLRGYAPTVLGTVVAATNKGSYSEPDRKLRERLRKLALQQAYLEDDEEALAILLATIMREYR